MTTTEAPSRHDPLKQKIRWARENPKSEQHRERIPQERFAELIGTSRRHVMRIERGQHIPRQALIERIAEVTGHGMEFFSDDDEEDSIPVGRHGFSNDLALALHHEVLRQVRREVRAVMKNAEPTRLSREGDGSTPLSIGG